MCHRREARQALAWHRLDAHLERQVRNQHGVVAVARALSVAIDGSLHVRRAGDDTRNGIRDSTASVILSVHTDLNTIEVRDHLAHNRLHLMGQRAAIGVAQHQAVGTVDGRCFEHL